MPGSFLDRFTDFMNRTRYFPGHEPKPPEAPATEQPAQPADQAAVSYPEAAETAAAQTASPEAATSVVAAPEAASAPAAPAEAPVASPAPAGAAPAQEKSAQELEEDRLWASVHAAWARNDFAGVTAGLNALRVLDPGDAAEIDEKLAAAYYNWGVGAERQGDTARALMLYSEALQRNPNLGQAANAVNRLQAASAPTPAPEAAAAEPAPAEAPAEAERTYTVESGDSLWAIAERFYGNGADWPRILDANRDQIQNPDMIYPGQTLKVP